MSGSLNFEKARRTRKANWTNSPADAPLYSWHRRNNKYTKRCSVCTRPVAPGSALMRKTGEHWEVAHSYHQDIANT